MCSVCGGSLGACVIRSRAAVPQELGLSARDPRCLGVAVRRIVLVTIAAAMGDRSQGCVIGRWFSCVRDRQWLSVDHRRCGDPAAPVRADERCRTADAAPGRFHALHRPGRCNPRGLSNGRYWRLTGRVVCIAAMPLMVIEVAPQAARKWVNVLARSIELVETSVRKFNTNNSSDAICMGREAIHRRRPNGRRWRAGVARAVDPKTTASHPSPPERTLMFMSASERRTVLPKRPPWARTSRRLPPCTCPRRNLFALLTLEVTAACGDFPIAASVQGVTPACLRVPRVLRFQSFLCVAGKVADGRGHDDGAATTVSAWLYLDGERHRRLHATHGTVRE